MELSEVRHQIVQQVGEPLNRDKVSASLKNLFATGRFRELRAEATPEGDGVALTFVGQNQYFIGVVSVEGTPKNLEEQGLVMATRLRLGQPMTDDSLRAADQHLSDTLADNGFYKATISRRSVPDPDTEETHVTFSIDPGPPATLSEVIFQGDTVVPAKKLESVAGWHKGMKLTSTKVERGLSKIRQFLVKRHYLQATLSLLGRNYDDVTNTEKLAVEVTPGQPIRIRIHGAHISTSKQKELLPMYSEGVADEFAIQKGASNLEDYLQRKGYFSATVQSKRSVDPKTHEIDVEYNAQPGSLGEFEGFEIKGNKALSTETLESAVTLQQSGFFHDRGLFSHQMLARDAKAMTEIYRSEGYLDAKVSPELNTQYKGNDNHLFVTFEVSEGPLTRVSRVTLGGVDKPTEKRLRGRLKLHKGAAYSPQNVVADRDAIRSYFSNQGYTQAEVATSSTPGPGEHEYQVEFQISPGTQEFIRRVILLGNVHTRDGVVRRELQFAPGEPLNQSTLLESQRRLYDLGVFNQVQVSTQDPLGPGANKTVLVGVEEAKRWTLGYGGGVEVQRLGSNNPQGDLKASPRVSLDLSRLNVGGRAQTISFHGRFSSLDKGASLTYYIPRFPTRPDIHIRIGALYDRSSDVLTFTSERAETSISFEKTYSASTLIAARFNFRNVKALNLSDRISEQQIPLASRAARIGMVGLTYINDHRDNPVDATKGSFSIADGGVSWSRFGSEANFLRISGENSTFYRLARHLIFARDTRIAIESPYGSLRRVVTTDANGVMQVTLTHDIPLPERFFMGGSESHRGFSINQAGPRDLEKGFPVGGNALFLNSFELRMPFADDRIGFVVFDDSGNVFSSVRKMRLLKFTQSSPTDFDYNVNAVGFGVRYKTPVGPLRIDFGYSLNPPRYQVVDSSTGNIEVQQLSRFQIFLGIGQVF